jgi:flagellar hook-basal body complex protein FliE
MSVGAISPLGSSTLASAVGGSGVSATAPTAPTAATSLGAAGSTTSAAGVSGGFASQLAQGVDALSGQQSATNSLAQQAAVGNLSNIGQYMTAANEMQLTTQLTVAVRDHAVNAFNQIMGMSM